MAEPVVASPGGQHRDGRIRGAARTLSAALSPAILLLIAALFASAFVLLLYLKDITFVVDEFDYLLHRGGFSADAILEPHNEHIVVLPVLIYKVLLAAFGMDSPRPFQLASTVAFLAMVVTVFVYARRRMGEWLALAAVLPILFLGGSYDTLLFPFQIGFFLAIGFGVGAVLALERNDRFGDRLACALLIGSILSSTIGVPFAIGIGVWLAIRRERRSQAWIAIAPLAVFAVWWLGWGRHADSEILVRNLLTIPSFALDGFSASLSTLLGLATPRADTDISPLDWGRPLLVAALGIAVLRLWRLGYAPGRLPAVVGIGLSFWALAALNASPIRTAAETRYQLMGVIAILLIAAELTGRVRLPRLGWAAVFAVALFAAASNLDYLRQGRDELRLVSANERAGLAAIEIARERVSPDFLLTPENSPVQYFGLVDAGSYLSAVDVYGSPAYTPSELASSAPEFARATADKALVSALGLALAPIGAGAPQARDCERVIPDSGFATIALPRGGAALELGAGGGAELALRRYASTTAAPIGELPAGSAALLRIPTDESSEPWELTLSGSSPATVCAIAGQAPG